MTSISEDKRALEAEKSAEPSSPRQREQSLWPARSWYKRILPRSLLGRSLLIILLPLVLVQVISTWVFYDRHYDQITKRLTQAVAGDISSIIEILSRHPEEETWVVYSIAKYRMWMDISLRDGEEIEAVPQPFFPSILRSHLIEALDEKVPYPFLIDTVSLDKHVRIQIDLGNQILDVLVRRKSLFSSTTYIFIMWTLGSSVTLFVVAFLFMRNQVRPIRRLAWAADSFGKGRDVASFKPEGASEVRQAAQAFIQMRERIKRQIEQRTAMLAGVSHDLRTPLTRMKLELAMLGDSTEIDSLKSDVQQMQQMIEGYLAFARGEGDEVARPVALRELLEDVAEEFKRQGAKVDLEPVPDLELEVRRETLRRALANLVGNAVRYGTSCLVRLSLAEDAVTITIDDDGPGIPADKTEEVFKPFMRLEAARNLDAGGTGLGLTIARDIVRGHGGEISLSESELGGLQAKVRIPT